MVYVLNDLIFLVSIMTNVVKFPGQEDAPKNNVVLFPSSKKEGPMNSPATGRKPTQKNNSVKAPCKLVAKTIFNVMRLTLAVVLQVLMVGVLNILYGFRKLITFMAVLGMAVTYYSQGVTYVADAKGNPATIYTLLVQSARSLANLIILRKIAFLLVGR